MHARTIGSALLAATLVATTVAEAGPFSVETPYTPGAFQAAQDAGKPIIVHITADWCSVCVAQVPILEGLREQPKYRPIVVFNVDFDRQKDIVRKFRANAQSTFIAFKGKLEEGRSSGDTRPNGVRVLLDKTM